MKAGLKVQVKVRKYLELEQRYDFEDARTFAQLLGPLPPAVHEIFSLRFPPSDRRAP